jgi:hydroxymethylglutaryl-CoA lyase
MSAVTLVEVGARDGLQNEPGFIATEVKLELLERLADAGLKVIEATAFVSPARVPQMADHEALMSRLQRRAGVSYPVLVPNLRGLEAALRAGVTHIAVFAAASETFSQRNIHCSIAESFERFEPVLKRARDEGLSARGYVSCVLGCRYEGQIAPEAVAQVAQRLWDLGCGEVSLGDTIGVGTPARAEALFTTVARVVPLERLAGHFHDTYGQALANIYATFKLGVRSFDSSVAGLGGCPYAPGASGNVATEDVVYLFNGLGVHTGVDLPRLTEAARFICAALGRPTQSKAGRAIMAKTSISP